MKRLVVCQVGPVLERASVAVRTIGTADTWAEARAIVARVPTNPDRNSPSPFFNVYDTSGNFLRQWGARWRACKPQVR